MTSVMKQLSAQQYRTLLELDALGCPVDYAGLWWRAQPVRIRTLSVLGTNLYPVARGAAFITYIEMDVAIPLTVYRCFVYLREFSESVCWLAPSQLHRAYYCLPPDLWIHHSRVLNHRLKGNRPLQRNDHFEGFLLGIFTEPIPASAAEEIPGVLWIEDLAGKEYWSPVCAKNRPLDSELLLKYREEPPLTKQD